jgi:pheromone shutdown protein TraB
MCTGETALATTLTAGGPAVITVATGDVCTPITAITPHLTVGAIRAVVQPITPTVRTGVFAALAVRAVGWFDAVFHELHRVLVELPGWMIESFVDRDGLIGAHVTGVGRCRVRTLPVIVLVGLKGACDL